MFFLIFSLNLEASTSTPSYPQYDSKSPINCDSLLKAEKKENKTPSLFPRTQLSLKNRKTFTAQYSTQEFTTELQNREWIQLGNQTKSDGKHIFIDIEIAQLKFINDSFKDKEFATALTNKHKELILFKVAQFQKQNPNLQIIFYSDFKSLRFAIKSQDKDFILARFNSIFMEANKEFKSELLSQHILRKSDEIDLWFRGGMGNTADQANIAARFSRTKKTNTLLNYEDAEIRFELNKMFLQAETLRLKITQKLQLRDLFENIENSKELVPKNEVFDLARKNESPYILADLLSKKYQIRISHEDLVPLLTYIKLINQFTAGIHLPKREIISLKNAQWGGVSLDFTGLGAYNLKETAVGLSRANNLDSALEEARLAEIRVTQSFIKKTKERIKIIEKFLTRKKGFPPIDLRCSGDDCIGIFSEKLSLRDQQQLVHLLSKSKNPSSLRIAFIGSGINHPEVRNQLATHGELIEKLLRIELTGVLPESELNSITFGVSLNGKELGKGSVYLFIGNSQTQLIRNDIEKIYLAFERALDIFNIENSFEEEDLFFEYEADYLP